VPTTWNDILDLGDRVKPDIAPVPEAEAAPEKRGAFKRLRESLAKSRRALSEEITASLFDRIDAETWERLEEALIFADAGASTTAKVVEKLEYEVDSGAVANDGVAIKARLVEMLAEIASTNRPRSTSARIAAPLMTGVNGTGKMTSIGKTSAPQEQFGLSVIPAPPTPTAAAAQQLSVWADRAGVDICAPPRVPTPDRLPTTRSKRPGTGALTWSSSTPPAAFTPRSTSWRSWARSSG
jgi:fused signal recognition particle receptor